MEREEVSESSNSKEECGHPDLELGNRSQACAASLKMEIEELLPLVRAREWFPSIGRAPPHLRSQDPETYVPKVVSFGPLHRGKKDFKAMDKTKLVILGRTFHGQPDNTLDILFDRVFDVLDESREEYSENIDLTDEEFAKLLVVDGCFLIVFCAGAKVFDSVNWAYWAIQLAKTPHVYRDLWVLENQLPFTVINELFQGFCNFFPKLKDAFPDCMSLLLKTAGIGVPPAMYPKEEEALNFLHLVCLSTDPTRVSGLPSHQSFWEKAVTPAKKVMHLVSVAFFGLFYLILLRDCSRLVNPPTKSECSPRISTATELREAGVQFQKKVNGSAYKSAFQLNVSWEDGTLLMPQLTVSDSTFHQLRSLIAFEQTTCVFFSSHITCYCRLLDDLINTPEDVRILRQSGILVNMLGSDSEVADMVNRLCKDVVLWPEKDPYQEQREEVRKFCQVSHNKWRAILVQNYFQSPWTIFSLVAAIILVVFTVAQTFLTIYPVK